MKERIILAPGAKGSELVKSLAMHGMNSFNLRICGAGELARISLMRSGVAVTEEFISRREETALIAEAAEGEDYFIPGHNSDEDDHPSEEYSGKRDARISYSDLRSIAAAVRQMRSLVPDGDEEEHITNVMRGGDFAGKNNALVSVYKRYTKLLRDRKLTDCVSLVRKALLESGSLDADLIILEEYPLSPLEKALIEKLSDGSYTEMSLAELFGTDASKTKVESYKNCYGAPNEVESILDDIYRGSSLDKCTVAVTDPGIYGQLFFDLALSYDLPITFGCGIPVTNSDPARLLALYRRWMTGGFFGGISLMAMLNSPFFNKSVLTGLYPEEDKNFSWSAYADILGGLRLTNDMTENKKRLTDLKKAVAMEEELTDPDDEKACKKLKEKKLCIPHLEVLAKEIALPVEDFISKYAYIRKGSGTNAEKLLMMLDMASVNAIKDEISIMRAAGVKLSDEEMIQNVLGLSVASCSSEEGKLFVTGIDGALTSVRENMYIAGLSASKYPGSPKENYLLLDTDLEMFGKDATKHLTSSGKIKEKHDKLISLVRLSTGLGSHVHISYAGLNVSELKKDNASSLIYELYKKEHGDATSEVLKKNIENVKYFAPAISATRKVGEAYIDGKIIIPDRGGEPKIRTDVKLKADRDYSPSALDTFNRCPRAFMLKTILNIPEPDEDDPFKVLAANESGNIAHSLMKELGNSRMTLEDFLELSEKYFEKFLAENPPLLDRNARTEKAEFLEMMETAYKTDPHREVVFSEEEVRCTHESGVGIHGFPDRVEKEDDGTYIVVDFKTARQKKHDEDDIETCLQNVMYAYLMEQNGFKISGTEYRYIRLGESVFCKYDDEIKGKLFEKLTKFREHLEAADFPIPAEAYEENRSDGDPDPCAYCKYGMICGKADETGGLGDE